MSTRELVTVRTVDAIEPIDGADAIEVAVFGGWRSVVRKGQYRQGDRAVYVEVDAALPLSDTRGAALGPYPSVLARKTDAERVQNLAAVYPTLDPGDWYATEKVDGTSTTFITTDDGLRVCGRNYEWAPAPELVSMRYAAAEGLPGALPPGLVVQGELYGPAIQANPLDARAVGFVVFAVWREGAQLPRSEWPRWAVERAAPVYDGLRLAGTVDEAIAQADGIESLVAPGRATEGIVWHRTDARPMPELDGRPCFKVISNRWLLRQGSGRRRRR